MPKLSIITVCKNEVNGIRRTLESIANQVFQDFELIVIDGASTDGSAEVIDEYREKITHFRSEADAGIYAAQNKGARAANGEYLLFINGGDAIHDDLVLQDIFSTQPSADIIYGDLLIEEHDGTETRGYSPNEVTLDFMLRGTLWHPVSFIRNSLLGELGLYDENLKIVADYDFFVHAILVRGAETRHVNRVIARFNLDGVSSNPSMAAQHDKERTYVQKKYFSEPVLRMFEDLEKYRLHSDFIGQKLESLEFELEQKAKQRLSKLAAIVKRFSNSKVK